jgi:acid phosphatase family membrane protein YuiD
MITQPFITIPLCAWLSAQAIKFLVALTHGKADIRYLYASGGMPSAHTAAIVAISTTIARTEGTETALFGLSLILTLIIIYDALGVRRASGIQALAIRHLLESNKQPLPPELGRAKGHTQAEVAAGCVLGFSLAYLLTT